MKSFHSRAIKNILQSFALENCAGVDYTLSPLSRSAKQIYVSDAFVNFCWLFVINLFIWRVKLLIATSNIWHFLIKSRARTQIPQLLRNGNNLKGVWSSAKCQRRKFITKTCFLADFTETESWKCDFNVNRLGRMEKKFRRIQNRILIFKRIKTKWKLRLKEVFVPRSRRVETF